MTPPILKHPTFCRPLARHRSQSETCWNTYLKEETPMTKVVVHADSAYQQAKVDPRLWSAFTEHLGRCIYGGLYEPGHPSADESGLRGDVMDIVRDLKVPLVRYPGGNFVSNYDWKEGIGPRADRPRRMEFAWASVETNQFGVDDFLQWAERTGVTPMLAVNLGTGTIKEAAELVEYCNHPGGTYWSDLRRANGHEEPYNVTYWCLGNEMEGEWQAGHLSAADYTKKALEAAKMMRWVDDSIKLVMCGSSYHMLPEYLDWDRVALSTLYPYVDYLSTHFYAMNEGQGDQRFVASYLDLDEHISNAETAIRFVSAKHPDAAKVKICLDEWNVWNFQDIKMDSMDELLGKSRFEMTSAEPWEVAPAILQEKYSLLDALAFGGLGITLLNHAGTVEIACIAQLVNVIAPLTTRPGGGVLKQSTYYPFELLSKYGHGTVLETRVSGDTYEVDGREVPVVHVSVVHDQENDRVLVFALNCDLDASTDLDLELNGFTAIHVDQHFAVTADALSSTNTWEEPLQVATHSLPITDGTQVSLPAASWNLIVLNTAS